MKLFFYASAEDVVQISAKFNSSSQFAPDKILSGACSHHCFILAEKELRIKRILADDDSTMVMAKKFHYS